MNIIRVPLLFCLALNVIMNNNFRLLKLSYSNDKFLFSSYFYIFNFLKYLWAVINNIYDQSLGSTAEHIRPLA